MSPTKDRCPVKGCPNPCDDANGYLCWRHRQYVKPVEIARIKRAEREWRCCPDERRLPFLRGELTRTINDVASKAAAAEQWLKTQRAGGSP